MKKIKAFDQLVTFVSSEAWQERFLNCEWEVVKKGDLKTRQLLIHHHFFTVIVQEETSQIVSFVSSNSKSAVAREMGAFLSEHDIGYYVINQFDDLVALPTTDHPLYVILKKGFTIKLERDIRYKFARNRKSESEQFHFQLILKIGSNEIFSTLYRYEILTKKKTCRIKKYENGNVLDEREFIGELKIKTKEEMEEYVANLKVLREKESDGIRQIIGWLHPYMKPIKMEWLTAGEVEGEVCGKSVRLYLEYCEMKKTKRITLRQKNGEKEEFAIHEDRENEILHEPKALIKHFSQMHRMERLSNRLGS